MAQFKQLFTNALIVMQTAPNNEYKEAFIMILKSFVSDLQQQTPEALDLMQTKREALITFLESLKSNLQTPYQTPEIRDSPRKNKSSLQKELDTMLKNLRNLTSEECYQNALIVMQTAPNNDYNGAFRTILKSFVSDLQQQTPDALDVMQTKREAFITFLVSLKRDQQIPHQTPDPVMKPLKVFLIITGQTFGAHQQLLDQLNSQGPRVTPMDDLQMCDVILLFCPVVTRVGPDVKSAVSKIPDGSQGKPVILVLMHHTRKSDQILNRTQWSEKFPCINQGVHVLYHQTRNGLLLCPRNQEAVQILQSICDSYMNKNQ